jgi:hypothetical protein
MGIPANERPEERITAMKRIDLLQLCLLFSLFSLSCKKDNPADVQEEIVLSHPWPGNSATGISTSLTLSWDCTGTGSDALVYDVYFGSANPPAVQIGTGQNATTLSRTGLANSATYYWKVNAIDGKGTITNGAVWSFTTGSEVYSAGMMEITGGTITLGSTNSAAATIQTTWHGTPAIPA